MISVHLAGHREKVAAENPHNLSPPPLYHQMRTLEALRSYPLVMNAYNTGTGKTRASLLRLFEMEGGQRDNVLFIAPTNELLRQHYEDISEFVQMYNLPFRPIEINAALLKKLGGNDVVDRGGEKFVRLIRSNGQDFHTELGIASSDHRKLPLILVTNPDLFYYAFLWQFAYHDQRNLFQQFVRGFRYIVIDEFHYYNSKQLANFLFFIALSKEWGYFEQGRRICLLSATPDQETRTYLNRIFGDDGWGLISPYNEPPESAQLPEMPTLAPLTLYLYSASIDQYAKVQAGALRQRLREGQHGALIANALRRVNLAYDSLSIALPKDEVGRITGAQPVEQRRLDQFKPLILATPTVDIGYNFKKFDKPRQNLDFVVFEAKFEDQLIQRMGRAGRVLGKDQVNIPSDAIALVSEDAISKLRPYDDQIFPRSQFASLLRDSEALPIREGFRAYVRSGGLLENAYAIFRLREMFPKNREAELEALFESIKEVFVPKGGISYQGMVRHWRRLSSIESWLRKPKDRYVRKNWLPTLIADFQEWLTGERTDEKAIESRLNQYLDHQAFVNGFRSYCEMERARVRAQFSFRDSFSGPAALVYDREHLLSGADVTRYDIIHLVENFRFTLMDQEIFGQATGQLPPPKLLCMQLHDHREERNRIRLRWAPPRILNSDWQKQHFEQCFVAGKPVALKDISFSADEPIPTEIADSLANQYVLALLIPQRLRGAMRRAIDPRGIYSRDILIDLQDGESQYHALLGTDGLLIEPLLFWAFQQCTDNEAAIIL